jgi:hypothetical protein
LVVSLSLLTNLPTNPLTLAMKPGTGDVDSSVLNFNGT